MKQLNLKFYTVNKGNATKLILCSGNFCFKTASHQIFGVNLSQQKKITHVLVLMIPEKYILNTSIKLHLSKIIITRVHVSNL